MIKRGRRNKIETKDKLVNSQNLQFAMNSSLATIPTTTTTTSPADIFDIGRYKHKLIKIEPKICKRNAVDDSNSPPRPLLICSPSEAGQFPVLLLLHGYLLYNSFYTQLIQHIASHGFIVIAPQLYTIAGPDSNEEIKVTAEITNWLPKGLRSFLPPDVNPDFTKLALSGHSRGGKVAFALSLTKPSLTDLRFSALIGIDPVDGMDKGKQTPPPVLTYKPNSFDLDGDMGVLIIGSGLGEFKKNPLFPPCAPKGVNHEDFYGECKKPVYYFVAKDYGHLDMLDDDTRGVRGRATHCLCLNGESREPMRRFVGGAMVAFLRAYLEGDEFEIVRLRQGSCDNVPVELQRVEFRV